MQPDTYVCSLIYFNFCFKVPLIAGVAALVTYFLIVDDRFGLVSECESWSVVLALKFHARFSRILFLSLFFAQPKWILILYIPAVVVVLTLLFCVSCRDPGLMERVTVSSNE